MPWIAIWAGGALVGTLGAWINLQAARFERRVKREARALFASIGDTEAPRVPLDALPAPVRRYLEVSGAVLRAPVAAARLRHAGAFVPKPGASPLPIRGEQYLTADPPGFVWWGRIRMAPGLWIDGRDRAVGGEGNMLVKAASSITLSDASGPELDQGALLRLLGELTWLPTAFRDPRHVTWTAIDDASARATLRVGGREVSATFHFGPDGLPARFTAERYRDVDGKGVLTPFTGETGDYRAVDGLLLPFRLTAIWHLEERAFAYARWQVEQIELDRPEPY